jgi:uncharacterized protein (UPF0333 family)
MAGIIAQVACAWRGIARKDQSGQVSAEYMLLLAVVVVALVLAFFLVVPGIRNGFVELAARIIAEKP